MCGATIHPTVDLAEIELAGPAGKTRLLRMVERTRSVKSGRSSPESRPVMGNACCWKGRYRKRQQRPQKHEGLQSTSNPASSTALIAARAGEFAAGLHVKAMVHHLISVGSIVLNRTQMQHCQPEYANDRKPLPAAQCEPVLLRYSEVEVSRRLRLVQYSLNLDLADTAGGMNVHHVSRSRAQQCPSQRGQHRQLVLVDGGVLTVHQAVSYPLPTFLCRGFAPWSSW